MTFEFDGNKSNIVPVASDRFMICLHQIVSGMTPDNIGSYTPKDILNKVVSIGVAGKFKIVEIFVPFQRSNVPDRIICCRVDKDFAAMPVKQENVQTFVAGLDCVAFSKNKIDAREGRTLSCSSKDVFMHTVPLEPGDSGCLLAALNGKAIGIHAGSYPEQKVSYAYRLDTLIPQVLDDSRKVNPKANTSLLALSESRDIV